MVDPVNYRVRSDYWAYCSSYSSYTGLVAQELPADQISGLDGGLGRQQWTGPSGHLVALGINCSDHAIGILMNQLVG